MRKRYKEINIRYLFQRGQEVKNEKPIQRKYVHSDVNMKTYIHVQWIHLSLFKYKF